MPRGLLMYGDNMSLYLAEQGHCFYVINTHGKCLCPRHWKRGEHMKGTGGEEKSCLNGHCRRTLEL